MGKYLFVIDYQNDFVDGALGFPGAEKLDGPIAEKVLSYGPGHVFCTRDTHGADYLSTREGRLLPIPHCRKGSRGWELYGRTAQACREVGAPMIDKAAFGMDLSDPAVAAVLPETAEEIELVGLVSSICVISNAVVLQSRYPQATIVVNEAYTSGADPVAHRKALDVMEGFQVQVIREGKL